MLGMFPTDQCLKAHQCTRSQLNNRLKGQAKLLALDRPTQIGLQLQLLECVRLHGRIKEDEPSSGLSLRPPQGQIRVP